MLKVVTETWNGLLDLLYPPKCLACGALHDEPLCADCLAGFQALEPPLCSRCGNTQKGIECRDCATGVPEHLRRARSAARFEGTLREAILRLKYGGRRGLAVPLGEYLAEYLQANPFGTARFDLIVPVPLHRSRLREREYNQAALLANEAARTLGISLREDVLERTRRTNAQVELRRDLRRRNVQGAFAVRLPPAVTGKTVLLIDDVLTTLNTADECARVLLNAGATAVYAASLAREV